MKIITIIGLSVLLFSCSQGEVPISNKTKTEIDSIKPNHSLPIDKADLVQIDGNLYSEYYPDKVTLKISRYAR